MRPSPSQETPLLPKSRWSLVNTYKRCPTTYHRLRLSRSKKNILKQFIDIFFYLSNKMFSIFYHWKNLRISCPVINHWLYLNVSWRSSHYKNLRNLCKLNRLSSDNRSFTDASADRVMRNPEALNSRTAFRTFWFRFQAGAFDIYPSWMLTMPMGLCWFNAARCVAFIHVNEARLKAVRWLTGLWKVPKLEKRLYISRYISCG